LSGAFLILSGAVFTAHDLPLHIPSLRIVCSFFNTIADWFRFE
jgi:hypothetical protein